MTRRRFSALAMLAPTSARLMPPAWAAAPALAAAQTRTGARVSALAQASAQAGGAPTRFQLAGMTLTYGAFPFLRALQGIRRAGFAHVAWGVTHLDGGQRMPVIAADAGVERAREIASQCRAEGLDPVMMFSTINLEEPAAARGHTRRIAQAAAARIPYLLTFGRTQGGQYENVVRCLKECGPVARAHGVTIVVKQHGGNTATGVHIARILREVADAGVWMCYDAGNVLDYERHDPLPDIRECWRDIRAFCIKDHRNWPKDEDCGPGFGEIDHYKLFAPVMRTGLTMPLAFENVFEPLAPRPTTAEEVDALNRRAREYVETVLRGLESSGA